MNNANERIRQLESQNAALSQEIVTLQAAMVVKKEPCEVVSCSFRVPSIPQEIVTFEATMSVKTEPCEVVSYSFHTLLPLLRRLRLFRP